MDVQVVFGTRDLSAAVNRPGGAWQAERLRWSAWGGPESAVIQCAVPAGPVGRWRDLLRCPVELFTADGQRRWWGYVSGVTLEGAGGGLRMALDAMRNVVVCRYTGFDGAPQVLRVTDAASVDLYGEKETLLDLGESSAVRAQAAARAVLERCSGAQSAWQPASGPGGAARVRLELRGWWHTLDWRLFYSTGQGSAGVETPWSADAEVSVGYSTTLVKCAQAVVDGHGPFLAWKALDVTVFARKVGSPTDTLQASLHVVDASGVPQGAALDSAAIPTAADLLPVRVSLSGAARVTPGTPLGVVLARSGAVNSNHYYRVGLNEQAGLLYPCRLWNGSAWAQRTPMANMLAWVQGGADTTELAAYFAAPERGGQFLRRVLIEEPSGVNSTVHEQRVRGCGQEISDLLRAGSAAGEPLLAEVDTQRCLRVFRADAESAPGLLVGPDGRLLHAWGSPVRSPAQALGRWARYLAWPDAAPVRVQGVEWSPAGGLALTTAPGRGWPR